MGATAERIGRELEGWTGAESKPHRFDGIEFRVRGHEIGHPHGDGLADLPFPVGVRKELVAGGKAEEHHVLPESGWTCYRVRGPEDVDGAIEPFRMNHERRLVRGRA